MQDSAKIKQTSPVRYEIAMGFVPNMRVPGETLPLSPLFALPPWGYTSLIQINLLSAIGANLLSAIGANLKRYMDLQSCLGYSSDIGQAVSIRLICQLNRSMASAVRVQVLLC